MLKPLQQRLGAWLCPVRPWLWALTAGQWRWQRQQQQQQREQREQRSEWAREAGGSAWQETHSGEEAAARGRGFCKGEGRCRDLKLQLHCGVPKPSASFYWHSHPPPGRKLKALGRLGKIPGLRGRGVRGLREEMGSESWAGGSQGGAARTPSVEHVVTWSRVNGAAAEGQSRGDFICGASQGWRRPASGEQSPLGGAPHPHVKRRTGTKVAGGLTLEKCLLLLNSNALSRPASPDQNCAALRVPPPPRRRARLGFSS